MSSDGEAVINKVSIKNSSDGGLDLLVKYMWKDLNKKKYLTDNLHRNREKSNELKP